MRVVATGPEASGTRLVERILLTAPSLEVWHLSMPHGEEWWDVAAMAQLVDRFVIIVRRPDLRAPSAVKAGHVATLEQAEQEWQRAMRALALAPHAYWLAYEALIAAPEQQIRNLSAWLGVRLALPEPIVDANAKWTSAAA